MHAGKMDLNAYNFLLIPYFRFIIFDSVTFLLNCIYINHVFDVFSGTIYQHIILLLVVCSIIECCAQCE